MSLPATAVTNLGNLLPNEILHAIFDHLSQHALTRIVLVSHRWRANAERLLYSSIVINEVLPRSSTPELKGAHAVPSVPAITLRCCETLFSYPHLAEYVRRFHVRWQTDAVESPALLLLIAQNIAKSLVPTLRHLDSLELSFGLLAAPPLPAAPTSFLPPSRHPGLRSLALHGIGEPPEPVLRNHPALLHLKLGDYRRPLHLLPTDVPRLRSFRGHPATAASVLPGRPIEALGLVGLDPATESDFARIAAGSRPVRSLDLSGTSVTPTVLRNVSRHLSHVEWLKVRLAFRHTLHYALNGMRLLTALTTVLSNFGNLRDLDLSPTNAVHYYADQNAVEEQRLCIAWTRACPSLRRIIFPSRTEWSLSEGGTWACKYSDSLARLLFRCVPRIDDQPADDNICINTSL
ncbi:hypothetical protein EDB92DRAFT_1798048 [Lactarius akahatsu]|uniref:F-box domain-containing protein n=1 Tax=Lactarius akahatsu TaxID=416441 RepID=A0AAD4QAU8_9AGAM|nr:hypothetical protein EDB92DRAFT_1798048 [Lactarius akahatsu]